MKSHVMLLQLSRGQGSESIKYVNAACGMKQDVVPRCRMKRETPVAVLGASCASVPRTAPSGERLAL